MTDASEATRRLLRLLQGQASDIGADEKVRRLIEAGADITVGSVRGYPIGLVIEQIHGHQSPGSSDAEAACWKIYTLLKDQASRLLAHAVLTSKANEIDEQRIGLLISLHADTHQKDSFPPVGLLGTLLARDDTTIRLSIVQKLVEGDPTSKAGLLDGARHDQSCLALARTNRRCPPEVVGYLQRQLDDHLNTAPFAGGNVDLQQIPVWIRLGANTEHVDERGNTVLAKAVMMNNFELVRVLVEHGADAMHRNDKQQQTPIDMAKAAQPRNPPLVTLLDSRARSTELKTMIEKEKSSLTVDAVKVALQKGAKVHFRHHRGQSLLQLLIANQCPVGVIVACVSDCGADLQMMDNDDCRALETCVLVDPDPCALLTKLLSLPQVQPSMFYNGVLKKSLQEFAVEHQRVGAGQVIEKELHRRLWTCVSQATTSKAEQHATIVGEIRQLVSAGAQINHLHDDGNYRGWSILHRACQSCTRDFVDILIRQLKADYVLANGNGDIPMGIAAECGQLDIVQYLRPWTGEKLNVANKDGQTPLHLATKNRHLSIVRYLVLWGADHTKKNAAQQTALDIAKANKSNKALINFLERLICPATTPGTSSRMQIDEHLEECQIVDPVPVTAIAAVQISSSSAQLGNRLLDAAERGHAAAVQHALVAGADVCYRRRNKCAYEMAYDQMARYQGYEHQQQYYNYSQILLVIQQYANGGLREAVKKSDASLVQAYHQAGGVLSIELLYETCATSDNVEIVDYLIRQSPDVWTAMIRSTLPFSVYRTARKNKHKRVAAYLKYTLSSACATAVKANDGALVRSLLEAGASADLRDTEHVRVALEHGNVEMMRQLYQHGAKIPADWPTSRPSSMPSDMAQVIDECLLARELRTCAARGDLDGVIRCQRRAVDINAQNCHGSTAVLCAMQHGNFFAIVHTLVSSGASILHGNDDESMSLIALAQQQHYDQIAEYLTGELNRLFIGSIVDNDRASADEYGRLGADFSHQDEQQRTALHYATEMHDVGLVEWLCVSGCNPNVADVHGDYPIILATQKGDYVMVEYLVKRDPAMKNLRNRAGLTAQKIAAQCQHRRIEQLLAGTEGSSTMEEPKHSREELLEAAAHGRMQVIEEFCDEEYESPVVKRTLCYELMRTAERAGQQEVVARLKPYYEAEWQMSIRDGIDKGSVVRLKEEARQMLLGMLTGLGKVIAGCAVVLDPADPETHKSMLSRLIKNVEEDSKALSIIKNSEETDAFIKKDIGQCSEQLNALTMTVEWLDSKRDATEASKVTVDEALADQNVPMAERSELSEKKKVCERLLTLLEHSKFLCLDKKEATESRLRLLKFLQDGQGNAFFFYQTMENLLLCLFYRVIEVEEDCKDLLPSKDFRSRLEPVPNSLDGPAAKAIKRLLSRVLVKDHRNTDDNETYLISIMSALEELGSIATQMASFMTLYYRDQIQSIDPSLPTDVFETVQDNNRWMKDIFIRLRPESRERMGVTMFGEYLTVLVIDSLNSVKQESVLNELLAEQIWLSLAKSSPIELEARERPSSIIRSGSGRQQIPVKFRDKQSKSYFSFRVPVKDIIGCASVVTSEGKVYEHSNVTPNNGETPRNTRLYGYLKPTLFANQKVQQQIIQCRQLQPARNNHDTDIQSRFDGLDAMVNILQRRNRDSCRSFLWRKSAERVSRVLQEQRKFSTTEDLEDAAMKARSMIEKEILDVEEHMEEKLQYYDMWEQVLEEKLQEQDDQMNGEIRKINQTIYDRFVHMLDEFVGNSEREIKQIINRRCIPIDEKFSSRRLQIEALQQTTQEDSNKIRKWVDDARRMDQQTLDRAKRNIDEGEPLIGRLTSQRKMFTEKIEAYQAKVSSATSANQQKFREAAESHFNKSRKHAERDVTKLTKVVGDADRKMHQAEQEYLAARESIAKQEEESRLMKEQMSIHREQAQSVERDVETWLQANASDMDHLDLLLRQCQPNISEFHNIYQQFGKKLKNTR